MHIGPLGFLFCQLLFISLATSLVDFLSISSSLGSFGAECLLFVPPHPLSTLLHVILWPQRLSCMAASKCSLAKWLQALEGDQREEEEGNEDTDSPAPSLLGSCGLTAFCNHKSQTEKVTARGGPLHAAFSFSGLLKVPPAPHCWDTWVPALFLTASLILLTGFCKSSLY